MRLKELFAKLIGRKKYIKYIMFLSELYHAHFKFKSLGKGIIKNNLVPRGGVVLDIGANIGRFTGFVAPIVGNAGRVYSIEPVAMSARILRTYVGLHGLKQVKVIQAALSSNSGTATISIPLKSGWKPQLSTAHIGDTAGSHEFPEEITLIDLDSLCLTEGISHIDFIKCDTEGHESFVFTGGLTVLKRDTPSILCEIEKPYLDRLNIDTSEVFTLLHSAGYQSYFPLDDETMTPVEGYRERGDYFFIHPSKLNGPLEKCIVEHPGVQTISGDRR